MVIVERMGTPRSQSPDQDAAQHHGRISGIPIGPAARWLVLAGAAVAVVGVAVIWFSSAYSPEGVLGGRTAPPSQVTNLTVGGVSFDQPASWRLMASDLLVRHYESIVAVVGTGTWNSNCGPVLGSTGSITGERCGPDQIRLPAGGVVVVISSSGMPPIAPGQLPRPSAAVSLAGGGWADASESASASAWTVWFPGLETPLAISAHYAEPGVDASRSAVRALVLSLRLVGG